MPTLSIALIAKNEIDVLPRLLENIEGLYDELVIIDTGSTDGTLEYLRDLAQVNDKLLVFPFTWIDDFAAARNASFFQCSMDWIMWLDADDLLSDDSKAQLKELLQRKDLDEYQAVYAPYMLTFDGNGKCTFSSLRERLIKQDAKLEWQGKIHESIPVPHNKWLIDSTWAVEHRPLPTKQRDAGRNLRILVQEYKAGNRDPRMLFYLANEMFEAGDVPGAVLDEEHLLTTIELYHQVLLSAQPWEAYYTRRRLAHARLGLPERLRENHLWEAIRLCPSRAEAYFDLGRIHYERQDWAGAIPFFSAAVSCRWTPDISFSERACYTYAPWDYLSVCYDRLGYWHHALAAVDQALLSEHPEQERLAKNRLWFIEQIQPKQQCAEQEEPATK